MRSERRPECYGKGIQAYIMTPIKVRHFESGGFLKKKDFKIAI